MNDIDNKYDVLLLRLLKYKSKKHSLTWKEKMILKKLSHFEALKNDVQLDSFLKSNDSLIIEQSGATDPYNMPTDGEYIITEKGLKDIKRYSSLSETINKHKSTNSKKWTNRAIVSIAALSLILNAYIYYQNRQKDDKIQNQKQTIEALKEELHLLKNDTIEKIKNVP